jgi:hypothetical protein
MNVDNIIHPARSFAELDSEDVTAFLRDRTFKPERLNLEFKSAFPCKDQRYDTGEICKDIVAFSNAQGGVVVYGVSARIEDPEASFPDYVTGLAQHPTPEGLTRWAKERVYPSVDLPPMRIFGVAGRKVAILKIPPGVNKPYCYYDPSSEAIWYFKRASGSVSKLMPDEIREFYLTALVEQAAKLLRSGELTQDLGASQAAIRKEKLEAHQKLFKPKLENIRDFGFVGMYSLPAQPVDLPRSYLTDFVTKHRFRFSEEMGHYPQIEEFQDAISVGYFPRAIRPDVRSTFRITLYGDGAVALDSQADDVMVEGKKLNAHWLLYQLQRHLQLSRALLEGMVEALHFIVDLENIEDFSLYFEDYSFRGLGRSTYSGAHHPIEREVPLVHVYPYDGDKRNVVMPIAKDVMDEVCRIFGYPRTPPTLWDKDGYLKYVRGLENTR